MAVSFAFADKQAFHSLLPQAFDILYANMAEIAPTGDTYEEDFVVWSRNIVPAMRDERRQMVWMFRDGELAGYFQYSIGPDLLMMEEIQIKKEHQGTGLFQALYRWLAGRLPDGLVDVEAYSDKRNLKSRAY